MDREVPDLAAHARALGSASVGSYASGLRSRSASRRRTDRATGEGHGRSDCVGSGANRSVVAALQALRGVAQTTR